MKRSDTFSSAIARLQWCFAFEVWLNYEVNYLRFDDTQMKIALSYSYQWRIYVFRAHYSTLYIVSYLQARILCTLISICLVTVIFSSNVYLVLCYATPLNSSQLLLYNSKAEQPYRERVISPNSLGFVAKTMILDLVVLRVQKQAFNWSLVGWPMIQNCLLRFTSLRWPGIAAK